MEKKYRFTLDDSIVTNIIKHLIILIVLLILIVFDVTGIINISTEYTKWLYIIIGVYFLLLLSLNARIIRYIEIGPKSITIVKVIGKIVLKDYTTIEPINLYLLDNDVTYRYQDEGQDIIMHGLTMEETSFNSNKYGSFTRISNNLNELAMVECNGKKYLINYPKELFKNIEQWWIEEHLLIRKQGIDVYGINGNPDIQVRRMGTSTVTGICLICAIRWL